MTELRGISPSRRGGPVVDRGSGMPLSHGSSEEMLAIKRYRTSVASRERSQVGSKVTGTYWWCTIEGVLLLVHVLLSMSCWWYVLLHDIVSTYYYCTCACPVDVLLLCMSCSWWCPTIYCPIEGALLLCPTDDVLLHHTIIIDDVLLLIEHVSYIHFISSGFDGWGLQLCQFGHFWEPQLPDWLRCTHSERLGSHAPSLGRGRGPGTTDDHPVRRGTWHIRTTKAGKIQLKVRI